MEKKKTEFICYQCKNVTLEKQRVFRGLNLCPQCYDNNFQAVVGGVTVKKHPFLGDVPVYAKPPQYVMDQMLPRDQQEAKGMWGVR